ncbi:hypothetical protein KX935_06450 [Streptobacillus moniliformis]|uniref:hypothetical protein n=1 Tax=Streptobacillus moniliformis TaxID=34105 RepID=UPI0007E4A1D0|nr:hypothetical protein [Streptobacillus moniliformis]QXW65421.1 hypothetical protein KX935_06450 [Streptobacillus moniliformis]
MKNFKMKELKSYLKHKVSINEKTIIRYIMLGFVGLSLISYSSWNFLAINNEAGTVGISKNSSNPQGENENSNNNSVIIGADTESNLEDSKGKGITVGNYVFPTTSPTSIGKSSILLREGAVTVANVRGMNTNGKNSIAYGDGSKATAPNSIVLGIKSYILGDKNQGDSIIIGNNAYIYSLYGSSNNKNGHNAKSVLALGNETLATLDNSVALGHSSQTDYIQSDLNKHGYTARGSYSIPSSAKVGVISVGKKGYERRIINVADGYRDSDAVNVSQLKTLEDRLDGLTDKNDDKIR